MFVCVCDNIDNVIKFLLKRGDANEEEGFFNRFSDCAGVYHESACGYIRYPL